MQGFLRKAILLLLLVLGVSANGVDPKPAGSDGGVPILVELFTSEGCSTCPPADAWLRNLDSSQPVPGAQLIVLSEHVTYWDRTGWRDPYSSAALSERQGAYARALGLTEVYTPQIIVNGSMELKKDDPGQTFSKAAAGISLPVRISSLGVDAKDPLALRASIEVDGASAEHRADVYAVVALNHAETEILQGENKGKRLVHVAVVQSLSKIGRLEKGKTFARETELRLKPGTDPRNLRVVVFVQETGPGKVIGASVRNVLP